MFRAFNVKAVGGVAVLKICLMLASIAAAIVSVFVDVSNAARRQPPEGEGDECCHSDGNGEIADIDILRKPAVVGRAT